MLERINAARRGRGLSALRPNAQLAAAAAAHAADLARHVELTAGDSHTGSDGSSIEERQQRAGYDPDWWGEITGWGFRGDDAQMFAWWMASPAHAATILKPEFEDAGVYELAAPGSAWGHYWVVEFGQGGADAPPEPERPYTSHVPVVLTPLNTTGLEIDLLRFKLAHPDCWRVVRNPEGQQEDVQDLELGGGLFVRRKNSLGEWHRYDDEFFYLVHDTSPAPGTEGIDRVYTLFKDGRPGAPKSRRRQAVGEEWHEAGLHSVVFRAKEGCRPLGENSGQAQNHSTIVRYERDWTFNRYGQGLTFDEVIWERTGVEMQIYSRKDGKSCGWIGWDAPWGSCEPVEIHWDRGRMTHEPSRVCGF